MRTIQFLDFEYFIKTSFSFDKKRYIKNYSLLSKMQILVSQMIFSTVSRISTQLKDYFLSSTILRLEQHCRSGKQFEVGSFLSDAIQPTKPS